jgi:hypothetical protein
MKMDELCTRVATSCGSYNAAAEKTSPTCSLKMTVANGKTPSESLTFKYGNRTRSPSIDSCPWSQKRPDRSQGNVGNQIIFISLLAPLERADFLRREARMTASPKRITAPDAAPHRWWAANVEPRRSMCLG